MLTIATGVFTAVDVTEATVTQKYWVSVNYTGIGRFAIASGTETLQLLKTRDIRKIRAFYEKIGQNTYADTYDKMYRTLGDTMDLNKLGLSLEHTEILYNMEYLKTLHDIQKTKPIAGNNKILQKRGNGCRNGKTI